MSLELSIGIAGMVIILVAYLLELFEKVSPINKLYILANFFGAVLLIIYSWFLDSIPFIILNSVWALGALIDFIKVSR